MLTISVKNFGPIAEGSVDLKPLTIFVGPSNTGKSYMATAVYAVAKSSGSYGRLGLPVGLQNMRFVNIRRRFSFGRPGGASEESHEVVKSFSDFVRQNARIESDWSGLTVGALPRNVRSWLEKTTLQQLESLQRDIIEQVQQMHGEEYGFVSRGRETADFRLSVSRGSPMLQLEASILDTLKIIPEFDISQTTVPGSAFELMPYFLNLDDSDDNYDFIREEIASKLAELSYENAFSGLLLQGYYLPAARSGIAQGHKVLSAALVRQSRLIGIERLNIPTLPGITTEFLSYLISLDKRMAGPDRTRELTEATGFIETEVLRGRIDLDESVGLPYPEIVYEPVGIVPSPGKFTLEHTSSMVSELAPLVLFLKYLVRPGDLLILEEPESHLHPAAQLQLARGIARLVNAGVQVLITTHSNDFTSQINNLISMSNVSEETWKSLGLVQEECLRPEQVSAYGFRMDTDLGGAVTYPLPVGSDVGMEDEEFLPVIELLYDQAIAMQRNRLS